PSSPTFPYTTLFRSRGAAWREVGGRQPRPGARGQHRADQKDARPGEQTAGHRSAPGSAEDRQAFVSRRRAAAARVGSEITEVARSEEHTSELQSRSD